MTEYYSLFAEYLNILTIIWGGVKFALLSFVLVLVILIVLKRYVLVKRRHKLLTYLAGSYYFFIPVICLCFGFIYGAFTTTRDEIIKQLPLYQSSVNALVKQNFDFDIEVQTYANQSLDYTIDETVTNIQRVMFAEQRLAKENQDKTEQFIFMVLESPIGTNYLKGKLKTTIASTIGTDTTLVDEIFTVQLSQLFTGEVMTKIIAFYITKAINSILLPFMIIWMILLLIPLGEIIFANHYRHKFASCVNQA